MRSVFGQKVTVTGGVLVWTLIGKCPGHEQDHFTGKLNNQNFMAGSWPGKLKFRKNFWMNFSLSVLIFPEAAQVRYLFTDIMINLVGDTPWSCLECFPSFGPLKNEGSEFIFEINFILKTDQTRLLSNWSLTRPELISNSVLLDIISTTIEGRSSRF